MSVVLYAVTHRDSGRVYVGKTADYVGRRSHHLSRARRGAKTHFHAALRKYGAHSFEWIVFAHFDTDDQAQLAEVDWISILRSHDVALFNQTDGGDGASLGSKRGAMSEEQRAKISQTKRGVPNPGLSERRQGKPLSQETRNRISLSQRGRPKSVEHNRRVSESKKGLKLSDEAKAKRRLRMASSAMKTEKS